MKFIRSKPIVLLAITLALVFSFLATAQGQGGSFGGILTYDPTNNWVLFTDRTGTWHAPLVLHNSAAPSNSGVQFLLNTDDQFEIQTFNKGYLTSFLDLDTDGSAIIYGSGGGGVGIEAATGDTCIPATQTAPCSSQALRVAPNGILKQYLGQPTAGHGMSTILFSRDSTLTGSFGPFTIYTTDPTGYGSGGLYRLTGYMTVTGASSGSTMLFTTGFTDETGLQYQNTGLPVPFQAVGDSLPFTFILYSQPGKPITISTTTLGGSPTYSIHLRLEEL